MIEQINAVCGRCQEKLASITGDDDEVDLVTEAQRFHKVQPSITPDHPGQPCAAAKTRSDRKSPSNSKRQAEKKGSQHAPDRNSVFLPLTKGLGEDGTCRKQPQKR
jgi:hypothetical protein